MQVNILKKVVQNTAGEQAVKIVDLLYGKKDVNEFLIAKKLGLTINQTRNLLYKLSHLGILRSIRKKDKRKGWYIYFWTFDILKSLEILEQTLESEILRLSQQLGAKKSMRFYKCKICGREATEETALLTNFTCSECGEVYELADNTPIIEQATKEIEKLQHELTGIRREIRKEEEEKGKKLVRFLKKEAKKKKELRMKKMNLKKRALKKLAKGKKFPKKSSKKPKKKKY